MVRRLAHEPLGWRPTTLEVTVRRYRCIGRGHVWRQDTSRAAEPCAKLSRRGLRWALSALVVQHLTVARVAEGLGVAWNTANAAVLAEGKRALINDPGRFDGVKVVGVTGIRDGTGASWLLDMVEGRSKQVFKQWLADRPQAWGDGIEVVAMTGSPGSRPPPTRNCPTR